ncbi:MAG: hypothetical protein MZW92_33920 [Comamonadaceae bacterium]|nr:hypothetical protein [Comamonadaceae bacterium]
MKSAGIGVGLIGGVVAAGLAGQRLLHRAGRPAGGGHLLRQATATRADAGFQWRMPVPVPGARDGGGDAAAARSRWAATRVVQATGLRDSSMLTQDENIVDIRFTVQYRLNGRARLPVREPRPGRGGGAWPPNRRCARSSAAARSTHVLYEQRDAHRRRPGEVDPGAARPAEGRHRDRQRQRAERAACPSRCRRRSTTRSRPAPTATASRTKARPTPAT